MTFTRADGLRYGLLGLPLAFVALPLYVFVPNHYAREFGVPLGLLGAVLLAARLLDAVIDPLIGRWVDRLYARSTRAVLVFGAAAAVLLAIGFALLFFPPVRGVNAALAWAGATLVLTYAGFSALSVAHQSWGALLGGDEAQRSRVVAWREGLGLVGVLLAAVAPTVLGLAPMVALFAVLLAAGCWAWSRGLRPALRPVEASAALWLPLSHAPFRRLLAIFMLNGIASAVPATLVLFFVQDLLQAPRTLEPAFLATYFLAAALSIPLWLALVRRIGLVRSWLAGMLLAIAAFACTLALGAGDIVPFLAVCAVSGAALGTDLALPGALLAGVIARQDAQQASAPAAQGPIDAPAPSAGLYFGWWNFATKLNLALAAGLALPLLALAGYTPGARSGPALQALLLAYCLLPCALKLLAAASLYFSLIRPEASP